MSALDAPPAIAATSSNSPSASAAAPLRPLISPATSASLASLRAHSATVAPIRASSIAHARPIPCEAPVTSATRPFSEPNPLTRILLRNRPDYTKLQPSGELRFRIQPALILAVIPFSGMPKGTWQAHLTHRRNRQMRPGFRTAAVWLGVMTAFSAPQLRAQTHWDVTNTLHIGGDGAWDYVTADPATHRLFVTRSTHTQVIDEETGKVLGDIPGQTRSHGVAIVPKLNRGFITDGGGTGAIIVFDL